MRNFVGAFCTLIVGLQVLVGAPLAVCFAFHSTVQGDSLLPMTFEVHSGPRFEATVPPADFPPPLTHTALAPPPNQIPTQRTEPDNPILEARQEAGSPLAGTVMAASSGEDEERLFVVALEKAAADLTECCETACVANQCPRAREAPPEPARHGANVALIEHLYAMAQIDEDAGRFDRADQWRALARDLRDEQQRGNIDETK